MTKKAATQRTFVLNELHGASEQHRLHALWVLEQIPYHNERINAALHDLLSDPNDAVGAAAQRVLDTEAPL